MRKPGELKYFEVQYLVERGMTDGMHLDVIMSKGNARNIANEAEEAEAKQKWKRLWVEVPYS